MGGHVYSAVQLCRSPNEDAHLSRRRVERMRGVSISLPSALIRQYEEAAEQLGLARSLVMRRAVERGLEGAVASLRRDLEADAGGRPREAGSHVVQLAAEAERRVNRLGKRAQGSGGARRTAWYPAATRARWPARHPAGAGGTMSSSGLTGRIAAAAEVAVAWAVAVVRS